MSDYEDELIVENLYLDKTTSLIKEKLSNELIKMSKEKKDLIAFNLEMWENTSHSSNDFDKMTEVTQYLMSLDIKAPNLNVTMQKVLKYEKLLKSPYFARFDFTEDGYEKEQIYIGICNIIDEKDFQIYIYDWRSPISSIF